VLYVGSLSQRKGLAYLLDAVETMGRSVELTLIGKRVAACKPLDAALQTHRWIDRLPHHGILDAMRSHDVLVFPSLFEGFGLVLTEALSQGMPILSTSHTCAPDIIEDGREGFIVPIRDADAIAEKLTLIHEDRSRLQGMKEAALQRARSMGWQIYQDGLVRTVQGVLKL
jgi:glycosyltransferase involved in cell wall biosynthesis